jgi:hypothetical protein
MRNGTIETLAPHSQGRTSGTVPVTCMRESCFVSAQQAESLFSRVHFRCKADKIIQMGDSQANEFPHFTERIRSALQQLVRAVALAAPIRP